MADITYKTVINNAIKGFSDIQDLINTNSGQLTQTDNTDASKVASIAEIKGALGKFNGSVAISGSNQTFTPVISNKASASVSGKTQITAAPTTATSGISKYYMAIETASQTAKSFSATFTASQAGLIANGDTKSTSSNRTVSLAGSGTYYIPMATAACTVSLSGTGNISPTISNKSASVSGKTQITAAPTTDTSKISTYYMAVTASGTAKSISMSKGTATAGWLNSSDQITASGTGSVGIASNTFYVPLASAGISFDGSISNGTASSSTTITANTTSPANKGAAVNYKDNKLGGSSEASTYVTISATGSGGASAPSYSTTYTNADGWLPAHSGTDAKSGSGSAVSTTSSDTNYIPAHSGGTVTANAGTFSTTAAITANTTSPSNKGAAINYNDNKLGGSSEASAYVTISATSNGSGSAAADQTVSVKDKYMLADITIDNQTPTKSGSTGDTNYIPADTTTEITANAGTFSTSATITANSTSPSNKGAAVNYNDNKLGGSSEASYYVTVSASSSGSGSAGSAKTLSVKDKYMLNNVSVKSATPTASSNGSDTNYIPADATSSITANAVTVSGSTSISGSGISFSDTDTGYSVSASGSASATAGSNKTLSVKDKYMLSNVTVKSAGAGATDLTGATKYLVAGKINNSATSGVSYTEINASTTTSTSIVGKHVSGTGSAVIPAEGSLYLNAGWYPNIRISLATLIPDDSNYTNAGTSQILNGYEAYNTNGVKLIGTMTDLGSVGETITQTLSGLTVSGGSKTINAGYTSGGTITVSSYTISSLTVPKDVGLTIGMTPDSATDETSDLAITTAAYRRVKINGGGDKGILIAGANGKTATVDGTTVTDAAGDLITTSVSFGGSISNGTASSSTTITANTTSPANKGAAINYNDNKLGGTSEASAYVTISATGSGGASAPSYSTTYTNSAGWLGAHSGTSAKSGSGSAVSTTSSDTNYIPADTTSSFAANAGGFTTSATITANSTSPANKGVAVNYSDNKLGGSSEASYYVTISATSNGSGSAGSDKTLSVKDKYMLSNVTVTAPAPTKGTTSGDTNYIPAHAGGTVTATAGTFSTSATITANSTSPANKGAAVNYNDNKCGGSSEASYYVTIAATSNGSGSAATDQTVSVKDKYMLADITIDNQTPTKSSSSGDTNYIKANNTSSVAVSAGTLTTNATITANTTSPSNKGNAVNYNDNKCGGSSEASYYVKINATSSGSATAGSGGTISCKDQYMLNNITYSGTAISSASTANGDTNYIKASNDSSITANAASISGSTSISGTNVTFVDTDSGFAVSASGSASATAGSDKTLSVKDMYMLNNVAVKSAAIGSTDLTGATKYIKAGGVSGGGLSKGTASGGGLSGGGLTAGAGSVTLTKYTGDGSNAGVNISAATGDAVSTEPSSGYYLAVKGVGKGTVSRAKVTRAAFSQTVSRADVTKTEGYIAAGTAIAGGSTTVSLGSDDTTIGATSLSSNEATGYLYIPINTATFSTSGASVSVATAGYIAADTTVGTVATGSATPSASYATLTSAGSSATTVSSRYFKITPTCSVGTAGYISSISNGTVQNYTVTGGSATTPATSITANPGDPSYNSSTGKYVLSVSTTKSVTPTVSAGWVSSGTAGTITVSGSKSLDAASITGGGLSGGGLTAGSGALSGSNISLSDTNSSGISVTGSGSVSRAAVTRAKVSTTAGYTTAKDAIAADSSTIGSTILSSNGKTQYVTGVTIPSGKAFNVTVNSKTWTLTYNSNGDLVITV